MRPSGRPTSCSPGSAAKPTMPWSWWRGTRDQPSTPSPLMADLPPVAHRYRGALRDFVTSRSESALQTAYEAGRTALAAGWGVLDMIRLHLDAQAELLASQPSGAGWPAVEEAMRAACAFLAESVSPFEMAHRGFRDAYATLRQSEARYRSLVDNAPYGIGRCRPDRKST